MSNPIVNGTKISFGEKEFDVNCRIFKILETSELFIVLFNWYPENSDNCWTENVFAFNHSGDKIWQIAPCLGIGEGASPYSNIFWDKDGKTLMGYAMCGIFYEINLADGAVKEWEDPDNPGPQRPW